MPQTARNGTHSTDRAIPAAMSHMNGAALAPLAASQSFAQEGFKLMARRAQAYAEWAEAVSHSATPADFFQAYSAWLARVPQDYLRTGAELANAVTEQAQQSAQPKEK